MSPKTTNSANAGKGTLSSLIALSHIRRLMLMQLDNDKPNDNGKDTNQSKNPPMATVRRPKTPPENPEASESEDSPSSTRVQVHSSPPKARSRPPSSGHNHTQTVAEAVHGAGEGFSAHGPAYPQAIELNDDQQTSPTDETKSQK